MVDTNTAKAGFSFTGFVFSLAVCDESVAIYESDKGGVLVRVEAFGEPSKSHYEQMLTHKECEDGIETRLVEMFVTNEADQYDNKARALSQIIGGLVRVND